MKICIALFASIVCVTAHGVAQETSDSFAESLRKVQLWEAAEVDFGPDNSPSPKLQPSLMTWNSPNEWTGQVLIWTRDTVPFVVGCIGTGRHLGARRPVKPTPTGRHLATQRPLNTTEPESVQAEWMLFHEYHLLSETPLALHLAGGVQPWAPADGLKRRPISDAAAVARSQNVRKTQLRQVVRRFKGAMNHEKSIWNLRLLPRPLYSYEVESDGSTTTGALFAFVWDTGTDPEMMVLLECKTSPEQPQGVWQYAPVRFTNRSVWLYLDDTEVWRVPYARAPNRRVTQTDPYLTFSKAMLSEDDILNIVKHRESKP